ncbi:MAG: glycosyltransferase, partial [Arcobacter sp.]
MRVVQLLPELNEGGVERGVVELNREFVKKGIDSFVISAGGKLEKQINLDGGTFIKFDVCSKNIFTVISRVNGLKKILKEIKPDIIHVRSRVPAWLVYFANKRLN